MGAEGRITGVNQAVATTLVGGAPVPLIGPNPKRCAIAFSSPASAASVIFVYPNEQVSATSGLRVSAAGATLLLTEDMIGDVIHDAWFAAGQAASGVAAIEFFYLD